MTNPASFDAMVNTGTGGTLLLTITPPAVGPYVGTHIWYRDVRDDPALPPTVFQIYGGAPGVQGTFILGALNNKTLYEVVLAAWGGGVAGYSVPSFSRRCWCLSNSDPITERIMVNLQTSLAGISVAGGFKFDIQRCYRLKKISGGTIFEYPCTQVFCESEIGEQDPKFYEHWTDTMNITIIGALQSYDDIETELNNLEADIIQAIQLDYTRGGLARWTKITGIQRIMAEAAEPEFGIVVSLEVKFVMPIGNPYKPV